MPAPISAIKENPEIGKERSRSSSKSRKDGARQKLESPPKAPMECLKNRTPGRGKRFRSPYDLRPRWGRKNKADDAIADASQPRRSGHPPAPRPLNIYEENVEEYDRPKAGLFAGDSFMKSDELHNMVIQICEDVPPISSLPEVPAAGAPVAATVTDVPAKEEPAATEAAEPDTAGVTFVATVDEKEAAGAADEEKKCGGGGGSGGCGGGKGGGGCSAGGG
ncbi:homeobox even-skipped homolog protein 2-like [Ananas comosus]|uniref:Homeobox even-skipped homolog protein 2-like n=1 Tax=Ananas comosus TaxID=4615 RepID=A0A6P5GF96_ANACO|nr:homeobox even-skipped homolog protein 2-like [Ananas comosus]